MMNFKRYSKQRNETLIVTTGYASVVAESICAEGYPEKFCVKSFGSSSDALNYFNSLKTKDFESLESAIYYDFDNLNRMYQL